MVWPGRPGRETPFRSRDRDVRQRPERVAICDSRVERRSVLRSFTGVRYCFAPARSNHVMRGPRGGPWAPEVFVERRAPGSRLPVSPRAGRGYIMSHPFSDTRNHQLLHTTLETVTRRSNSAALHGDHAVPALAGNIRFVVPLSGTGTEFSAIKAPVLARTDREETGPEMDDPTFLDRKNAREVPAVTGCSGPAAREGPAPVPRSRCGSGQAITW